MIFCEKCFRENRDGTLFCERCGTTLLAGSSVAAVAIAPNINRVTPPQLPRTDLTPATPPRIQHQLADEQSNGHSAAARVWRIRLRLTNGKAFELTGKTSYLIGRYDAAAEVIPDVDLTEWNGAACGVSRRHARINVDEIGVSIEDLESLNETVRNGYRLLPYQKYPLSDGDELRLGSISLLVVLS